MLPPPGGSTQSSYLLFFWRNDAANCRRQLPPSSSAYLLGVVRARITMHNYTAHQPQRIYAGQTNRGGDEGHTRSRTQEHSIVKWYMITATRRDGACLRFAGRVFLIIQAHTHIHVSDAPTSLHNRRNTYTHNCNVSLNQSASARAPPRTDANCVWRRICAWSAHGARDMINLQSCVL